MTADALAQYEAIAERAVKALAEEVRDLDVGWTVRTRSLPWVWTLNQLCVTRPVGAEALVALADEVQADLPFRHVYVRHAPTADAAEPLVVSLGWRVERDVVMALGTAAPVASAAKGPELVELTEDEMALLMRAWVLEEHTETSAEGLAQVVEWNRLESRRFGERRLGVRDEDGTPLAVTKLRREGAVGWVEDVYTTPSARGRGYARALVTRAVELALHEGCAPVVIVADADDWPQHLYASLGFRPVGSARIFHLDPETAPLSAT